MTAQLALGTYRCQAIPEAAARAAASGAWIDTAPNYATGRAQILLAPALAAHPSLNISTKAGYFTAATGTDAVNDGALTEDQAAAGHSLAPEYVRWQVGRNREQLGRERLDLVLLHNPERAHRGDRPALHRAIRDALAVLEEAVAAGHVTGYGIATWAGLEEEAFTVGELLALAAEATGGQPSPGRLPAAGEPGDDDADRAGPSRTGSAPGRRGRRSAGDGVGPAAWRGAPRHGRPGARRHHPAGPDPRTGVRPRGRVMPRSDGRPHRRFQCATLEAGGRRRHPTLADRRQVAEDHWCTRRPLTRTPNSACAPITSAPRRPWTYESSRAGSSGVGPGAPWVPRPAPPPGSQPGCGWCRLRRTRRRGSCGMAPWKRSTPSASPTGIGLRSWGCTTLSTAALPTGRSCRPASMSRSCPATLLRQDLDLPDSWWEALAGTLEKLSATSTDRLAVREQYMNRAIPEFVGIPAPAVTCWTTAHADLHWANLTESPLRLLDWEGWGQAPQGFDCATLYAYTLLQPNVAARVRAAFPILGSPAGLAAEATVCAQLLQTVSRGDNLVLEDRLRDWSKDLRRRQP